MLAQATLEHWGAIHMEEKQSDHRSVNSVPGAVSPEEQPLRWVAPRESMRLFSIAEFTRIDSFPGDDGLGIFTSS